ncbi:MAG: transposase [Desulfovibrio sp.]|nr:transposase [Desulfovibrio sp.]
MRDWIEWQKSGDFPNLVFLYKAGIRANIKSNYGRSKKGKRRSERSPGAWKSTPILCAINSSSALASTMINGSVDKRTFKNFMKAQFLPVIERGRIVIVDNLSLHEDSFDLERF